MSTGELERAVQELPAEEFASFAAWFEEYLADRWDGEMEQDIAAGRLGGGGGEGEAGLQGGPLHAIVNHSASPDFWFHYRNLPEEIQRLADKNFELLKADPRHSSLRLKKIGEF